MNCLPRSAWAATRRRRSERATFGNLIDRFLEQYRHRDATMVLLAYRHGLRASELIDLRWDQVDVEHALLHVRRAQERQSCHAPIDR